MVAQLSVNLNAIALLRNRRDLPWPSLTEIGRLALQAGARGLTAHPRPDQRHIRFSDLAIIRNLLDDEFPGMEFNMEGYPTEEFLALVEQYEPEQVTLVPDDPAQATSDHGWDFPLHREQLAPVLDRLKQQEYRVSVFVNPDEREEGLKIARDLGADRIELYTGPYGGCHDDADGAARELAKLAKTAALAGEIGLGVNAGHDLTVDNLAPLAASLPNLLEVSIGNALTADALTHGMATTVKRYLTALSGH